MKKHYVLGLLFCSAQFFLGTPCLYGQFSDGATALNESRVAWRSWHLTNKRGADFLLKVSGNTLEATDNTINDASTFIIDVGPDDANWATPDSRWFYIRSLSTGLCVTVATSGDLPRSVSLGTYDAENHAQQFRLVGTVSPSQYKLRSRLSASGPDLVLETNSNGVLQADNPKADPSSEQKFAFNLAMPSGNTRRYALISPANARYMSDNGIKSEGTQAVQRKDADESAFWRLDHADGDYYRLRNDLTQQFLTAPTGASAFSVPIMTGGTYGARSEWKLRRSGANFLLSSREFPDLYVSVNFQASGESLLLVGADDLNRRFWIISMMPGEVSVATGDYDRIESGTLNADCFFSYGTLFKKALCERVGLSPEQSELYFDFLREAIAAKVGQGRVDELLQKFDLNNAGHRVDLALMVRYYLTEVLPLLPYEQWPPAAQAVATELQTKVQQLRLDYADRLFNAWSAYVAEHGNNLNFSDLYFFWIDGDGFEWAPYYNMTEAQGHLMADYTSGAATFEARNAAIVGNVVIGAAAFVSALYVSGTVGLSLIQISDAIFTASTPILGGVYPFTAIVWAAGPPISIAAFAAAFMAVQVLEVMDFQDFINDFNEELDWAQQGINLPATLSSTNLLDRIKLLSDLDFILGAPVTGNFGYNTDDNVYVPPFTFNCPDNVTLELGNNGTAALTSENITNGSLLAPFCGGEITFDISPNQFGCDGLNAVQTVAVTAQNSKKSQHCNVNVTLKDVTPPSIACPANIVRNTDANQCGTTVDYGVAASDNCSYTLTRTAGPASGATFQKGGTNIAWRVTDGAGLTAACSFTVTVNDVQPPSIACPANIVRSNDANQCGAAVAYSAPTASDNCGNASLTPPGSGLSGAVFPLGPSTVTWMATDAAGLTSTCAFTVTVYDTQQPTLACPATQTRSTDLGRCDAAVTYATPTAFDNCGVPNGQPIWISGGGTPVPNGAHQMATFAKGITTVQWLAADAAGNTRSCTFRVVVNDTEAPILSCPGPISVDATPNLCSAAVSYTTPTFMDNCAPTSGTAVRIGGPASGSAFPVGTTKVTFRATDAAGNARTCSLQVSVTDNQAPTINCPPPMAVTGGGSPCAATVFYAAPTAADNCAGILTPFLVSGAASGSAFPAGTTSNLWRAVAPNGQSAECSVVVTVDCLGPRGHFGSEVRPSDLPSFKNLEGLGNGLPTLAAYPNPFTDRVTVVFSLPEAGEVRLRVVSADGRIIAESTKQGAAGGQEEEAFEVPGAAGVYFCELWTAQGRAVKRLVKRGL